MNTVNQAMLIIKSLDNRANLEFSEWTHQWYVSANIDIGDGCILEGITEHRDDPASAVTVFLNRLQSVDVDHYIVTNAGRDERRHWRWNGAAFTEIPMVTSGRPDNAGSA